MHPAPAFRTTDRKTLLARFRDDPFCTVVAVGASGPVLTHTPVIVDDSGALRFHVAAANRVAPALAESGRALVSTLGAHTYINPAWYEAPDQVGTWNYVSAEAEGALARLSEAETRAFLHDLAATFDGPQPWTEAQVAPDKMARMLSAIRAYRLVPDRLEGTTKLSQNKPGEIRARVVEALGDDPVAALMRPN